MKKPRFVIVALAGALVLSNAFWLYRLLDAGITYTYMQVDREDSKRALQQTLKLLPLVASGNATHGSKPPLTRPALPPSTSLSPQFWTAAQP